MSAQAVGARYAGNPDYDYLLGIAALGRARSAEVTLALEQ